MENDLLFTGISSFDKFDIRRDVTTLSPIGGSITTSTAIETRKMELQHLRGDDLLEVGGLKIEANFRGFCHNDTDIKAEDVITPNSGATEYRIAFVQDLWTDHIEFFARIK